LNLLAIDLTIADMRIVKLMKKIRVFFLCVILLFGAGSFSGCVTEHQDYSSAQWDDMTWAQKTGCYVWWIILEGIYGVAQGGLSFSH
jgi:ABC-type microcin C transport system permease subunit YejB